MILESFRNLVMKNLLFKKTLSVILVNNQLIGEKLSVALLIGESLFSY
jgi:hypothetical protein